MTAVLLLLVVLTLSFLVTRLATEALALTGLSRELARLQAVSAFTGVGFTTIESERIVAHPVRRRVLLVLMVAGNAGFVTVMSSLILTFVGVQSWFNGTYRLVVLAVGLALLWFVAASRPVEQLLHRVMRWAMRRWTRLDAYDYVHLLRLAGEYSVREVVVEEGDWWAERRLDQLEVSREGVLVLGIHRADGDYLPVPRGETCVRVGDRVVLYGRDAAMDDLDHREAGVVGERRHEAAVALHLTERTEQAIRDEESEVPGEDDDADDADDA